MILLDHVEFNYPSGNFSVAIDALEVSSHEKVAVIGPSGTGKTTLLNLVAGILIPEKGDVTVGSHIISEMIDRHRRAFRISNIGFIFQAFELIEYLNVMDNILHPYRISPALELDNKVRERAVLLARDMGIEDKLQSLPEYLSQGEKQRAAICRAMLPRPSLILADEATGNLDPKNKERILDLLFEAVEQHQSTLLAVTHDHDLLTRFDRVIDFQDFRKHDG